MVPIKELIAKRAEIVFFITVYLLLFSVAVITNDSIIALISAFCGITYTILAGKGYPVCYLIGVTGSGFYAYLAFINNFWGNLILYLVYYIPMQIFGFFKWNKHLKTGTNKIIKTALSNKEKWIYFSVSLIISAIMILILAKLGDKNPVIDGITTIFSILGLILTVKRCLEQWIVWMIVNGLSFIMWLFVVINGTKVYSTLTMWAVYFVLAIYFYVSWKKELKELSVK